MGMRNGEIASYSIRKEDRGGGGGGGWGENEEEEKEEEERGRRRSKQEDTCKVKEFVPHWSMAYTPSLGT